MAPSQYSIPAYGSLGSRLHGWLLEAVQEGGAWLDAQRPARDWESIIKLLASEEPEPYSAGLSSTGYNKTKRIAREIVASLTTFRHEGEIKPTADDTFYEQAHVLTRLDRAWYRSTHAYDSNRKMLQNGVALGTSYVVCEWDKHLHGPMRGDIRQTALMPDEVTFLQLPKDGEIQRAYGVLIKYELPINLARAIYGPTNKMFAESLTPDRDSPGWLQKGLRKLQQFVSPALRVAGPRREDTTSFPTVDVFHLYTVDGSINDSSFERDMGTRGTNWSYKVPSIGDPIPTGIVNPATGSQFTRPAREEDCLLFPLRRLTIFSRSTDIIGYDGSSPWWHGKAPVVRLKFSDWPWEALGQSLLADPARMQEGVTALMRYIEDASAARLDPPAIYDETLASEGFAQAFNPRLAGSRAKANLSQGEIIQFPVPPEHYNVPAGIYEWVKEQEGRMDYLAGVQDLSSVAKARQLPAADSLEKLLEMAGPLVQDMVQAIKDPLQRLGDMRLSYYFQFYTNRRIIQETGDEGLEATADIKFTPDLIVPVIDGESLADKTERAKRYIHEFHYHVSRSGITEIHRMTTKLFYLQLMKLGFPISWWTFAKVAEIPNFGPEPTGTHNELELWVAQKHMERELAEELAAGTAQAEAGAQPVIPGQPPPRPGRPNSFNKPPTIQQKDGGTRSTLATS